MKNLLFLLAGVACLSLTSCDNDDDTIVTPDPQVTRMEMITAQEWTLASMTELKDGKTIDLQEEIPLTSRDDIFRFNNIGEAVREEGPSRENGNPDIVEASTFELRENESQLQVAFDRLPINDQIVEMTPNRMVLRNFDGVREVITTFRAE